MNRRSFLDVCGCAAAATLLGCAGVAARVVPVVDGRARLRLADHPELAQPGGSLKIAPGGSPDPIFVLAEPNGSYTALSSRCTHRGCVVDVQGPRIVCPCHGSTYDRDGRVLRGPAERALARYDVTRSGDYLEVRLESTS
jgi:Rieske Fe-S protein